jgi:O-antigen ligase
MSIIFGFWGLTHGYGVLGLTSLAFAVALIVYGVLFLVTVITAATFLGVNPDKSFASNFERMEGLVMYLHLALYFIVAVSMVTTEKLWKWFWSASAVVSIVVSLQALSQLLGKSQLFQGDRIESSLGNATYLAVYALFHIFIGAYFAFRSNKLSEKIFFWVISFINFVILFFTATRGAVVGLGLGIITTLVLIVFLDKNKKVRRYGGGVLIAFALLGGVFFMARDSAFVHSNTTLERISNISLDQATIRSRFMIWQMAWQGFGERPLLGWGPENFTYVFSKYYNPAMYDQEPWFDRAHNVFLDWLISAGILGLGAYLLLFGTTLYYLVRGTGALVGESLWHKVKNLFSKEKDQDLLPILVLIGFLVAYFTQNIFVFDNLTSLVLFFSLLAYIHTKYASNEKEFNILSQESTRLAILLIGILLSIFLFYTTVYKPYSAGREVITALSERSPTGVTGNLTHFKNALAYNSLGDEEIREQLYSFALLAYQTPQVPTEQRKAFIELALSEGEKNVKENPQDARTALLFGQFLFNIKELEAAEKYVIKAHELSPQKQLILFFLGNIYLQEKKYQEAAETFDKAYALLPANEEGVVFSALGKIFTGKKAEAKALLKKEFGREVYPDERLLSVYLDTRNMQDAREIWNVLLKEKPARAEELRSLVTPLLGL